ncbi:hypothetical protein [Pseudorhodobacter antarcticus]|nr:hypothetical protein [Pseudorhodobacter antarcticus]
MLSSMFKVMEIMTERADAQLVNAAVTRKPAASASALPPILM